MIKNVYIHIGNGKNLRESRIIGVFDADIATQSDASNRLLRKAERSGKLHDICGGDVPRTFAVTAEGDVWLTKVSAGTIFDRIKV